MPAMVQVDGVRCSPAGRFGGFVSDPDLRIRGCDVYQTVSVTVNLQFPLPVAHAAFDCQWLTKSVGANQLLRTVVYRYWPVSSRW